MSILPEAVREFHMTEHEKLLQQNFIISNLKGPALTARSIRALK